jgi:hypothetical protein
VVEPYEFITAGGVVAVATVGITTRPALPEAPSAKSVFHTVPLLWTDVFEALQETLISRHVLMKRITPMYANFFIPFLLDYLSTYLVYAGY